MGSNGSNGIVYNKRGNSTNLLNVTGPPLDLNSQHLITNNVGRHNIILQSSGPFKIRDKLTLKQFGAAINREWGHQVQRVTALKSGAFMLTLNSAETLLKIRRMDNLKLDNIPIRAQIPMDVVTVEGVIHNVDLDTDLSTMQAELTCIHDLTHSAGPA